MPKPKRYAMAMDTARCVGCNACVISCKNENAVPLGYTRDWVTYTTTGKFPTLQMEMRSERCNHCSDTPCVSACPTGSSHVNKDGIVLVDHNKCSGCKACITACPYDARFVHPDGYVEKCTFCEHRLKRGLLPGCVSACPTKALQFGDLNDPESVVSKLLSSRKWKVLKPEAGTKPTLYFLV